MLRGCNSLTIDAKGRVSIPGRHRAALLQRCGGRLVVTVNVVDHDHCLWLYPMDAWEIAEREVAALPDLNPKHRRLKRLFIGHAREADMDKSGRLLLPAELTEFARIEKNAFLVGQSNKFELWNEELWKTQREQWRRDETGGDELSVEMEQLKL